MPVPVEVRENIKLMGPSRTLYSVVRTDAQTTNPNKKIRATSEVKTEHPGHRRQRSILGVGGKSYNSAGP